MDIREINLQFVSVYKVLFFIFGTIGNVLFIHLTIKRKQLRTRTSILQSCQCFFHLFCQLGTVVTGITESRDALNRSECFNRIAFYVFFQAAQGLIMVIIVADILIFVRFPIFYRSISLTKYTLITSAPVLIFSVSTTFIGYLSKNEDRIPSCSPPFVFLSTASIIYKYIFIAFSIIVMVLYTILIMTFRRRRHINHQNSLKTIKRLQLTVVIFILTWFFSQVFGLFILKTGIRSSWGGMVFAHNLLFICLSYSNTFYVTMWRCKEYRDQFYSVWWPRKNSTVFHTDHQVPRPPSLNHIVHHRQ